MFEHPGHRGAVHLYSDCVKAPDYELSYGKAIALLQSLPGVDERLGIAGLSFGGYIAPCVAAKDNRIKACAAATAFTGWRSAKNFQKWNRFGGNSPLPIILKISGAELLRQADLFHNKISSTDKILKVLSLKKNGTSDHCQLDNISAGQSLLFDWFAGIL